MQPPPAPDVALPSGSCAFASGWPRALLRAVVDVVLPPRCYECGAVVDGESGFCSPCWQTLDFLGGPACARCDVPLPQAQGEGALCGECISKPPPYDRVLAPLAYGPAARHVVMRFKYGRRVTTAGMMARLMLAPLLPVLEGSLTSADAGAGQGVDAAPVLVPVPLHRWRLWWRGFNQAALLAQQLSLLTNLPFVVDAMVRRRPTGSMRGQGRSARQRLVRGAFAVTPARAPAVDGRHVILVDDVFTTGATAAACARALSRAGAARVSVVAFARVLPGRHGKGAD